MIVFLLDFEDLVSFRDTWTRHCLYFPLLQLTFLLRRFQSGLDFYVLLPISFIMSRLNHDSIFPGSRHSIPSSIPSTSLSGEPPSFLSMFSHLHLEKSNSSEVAKLSAMCYQKLYTLSTAQFLSFGRSVPILKPDPEKRSFEDMDSLRLIRLDDLETLNTQDIRAERLRYGRRTMPYPIDCKVMSPGIAPIRFIECCSSEVDILTDMLVDRAQIEGYILMLSVVNDEEGGVIYVYADRFQFICYFDYHKILDYFYGIHRCHETSQLCLVTPYTKLQLNAHIHRNLDYSICPYEIFVMPFNCFEDPYSAIKSLRDCLEEDLGFDFVKIELHDYVGYFSYANISAKYIHFSNVGIWQSSVFPFLKFPFRFTFPRQVNQRRILPHGCIGYS